MRFVSVFHWHQPVGTLDSSIDQATEEVYLPSLAALAEVPAMQAGAHLSGSLLTWAQAHRPDLIEALHGLAGQLELIGGALHDPLLGLLPDRWRRRQIEAHRLLLEELLQRQPQGVWLAEGVWEPTLTWLLNDLGAGFTLVGDSLFDEAGANPHLGAVVDHLGRTLRVLPINRTMTELVAMGVDDALAWFESVHATNPDGLVVVADGDGFGRRPDRFRNEEVVELLRAVTETSWIDVLVPSQAATGPAEPAALPAGGGMLPPPWKRSLLRYPEATVVYRKMLALTEARLPDEAVDHVLAAQTSEVWWHGQRGGVYLPHLRSAVHEHLIAARREVDGGRRTRSWTDLTIRDWDADGQPEVVVELPDQSWVLHACGAFLFYDDKPSRWAVADVMGRHREAYHQDPDRYDGLARRWLTDRMADPEAGPAGLFQPPGGPAGYELEAGEAARGSVHIKMAAGADTGWRVEKELTAHDRTLELTYTVEDLPSGRFGPELPISVSEGAGRLRVDGGEWAPIDRPFAQTGHRFRFEHTGRRTQLLIDLRLPGAVFAHPLTTTVRTSQGLAEIYQGIVLWPHFLVGGDGTYTITISVVDSPEPE